MWVVFVSSKHIHIGEYLGMTILNTVNLYSIDRNNKINLTS